MYTGSFIDICPPFTFLKFLAPFQKSSKTNYTSIESPNIELFESGKKLGVAPSWRWPHPLDWKSNNFTKIGLEPSMTSLTPISKLISCTTIQGFLKRYITLSWINWLRNGDSSKFNEENKVPTLLLKLIWSLPWQTCFQFHNCYWQPQLRAF